MKIYKIAALAAIALLAVACTGNQKPKVDPEFKDLLPSKGQVDTVSYLVGISFGSTIKQYDMQDLNMSEVIKGIKDMAFAKGEFQDPDFTKQFKVDPQQMNTIINDYLMKKNDYKTRSSLAKSQRFLRENILKEGVDSTASGLQYMIIEPGSEIKATDDRDTVVVLYKGTTIDGKVFDESGDSAVTFPLNGVIKGWTEGLKLVGEGGKLKLFIPSELAYGPRGTQGIEPNAALIFDVELKEVHPFVEKPAEPEKPAKKK